MPLYEYHCNHCQTDHELLVRSRRTRVNCPKCGSRKLAKKLSVFAASKETSGPVAPACSGNPQSCGRCSA